jgi:hypothetical protein
MLTADQARLRARNDMAVYEEIKAIEMSIIEAAMDGTLDCTVSDSPMTIGGTSQLYYGEWTGGQPDNVLRDQMAQVMLNFTKLGYSIERKTNANTGDTFSWIVAW